MREKQQKQKINKKWSRSPCKIRKYAEMCDANILRLLDASLL